MAKGSKSFFATFFSKKVVLAYVLLWFPRIARVRARYVLAHGRAPNLLRPRRYTEKMQWRKLFDANPDFTVLCDKLAVRGFITSRIGAGHLPELLWSGLPSGIPFSALEPPFVLKSNHASGQVIMVHAGQVVDQAALQAAGADWLALDYGAESDEPGYQGIARRLMVERTLATASGGAPEERRLFVFDGKVALVNTVFTEGGKVRNGAFHTPDWRRLDWHFSRHVAREFPAPARLAEMIQAAERLGAGFEHLRVDIYDCDERFYVGEISLYSWSGVSPFTPDAADFELGAHWRLRLPALRAAARILRSFTGRRHSLH